MAQAPETLPLYNSSGEMTIYRDLGVIKLPDGLYFNAENNEFTRLGFMSTTGIWYRVKNSSVSSASAVYHNNSIAYLPLCGVHINETTGEVRESMTFEPLTPVILTEPGDYSGAFLIHNPPEIVQLSNDFTAIKINNRPSVILDGFCEKTNSSIYAVRYQGTNYMLGEVVKPIEHDKPALSTEFALFARGKVVKLRRLWYVDITFSIMPDYKCYHQGHSKYQCSIFAFNDSLAGELYNEDNGKKYYCISCGNNFRLLDQIPPGKLTKPAPRITADESDAGELN